MYRLTPPATLRGPLTRKKVYVRSLTVAARLLLLCGALRRAVPIFCLWKSPVYTRFDHTRSLMEIHYKESFLGTKNPLVRKWQPQVD